MNVNNISKNKVIWGTGINASVLAVSIGLEKISFFIDGIKERTDRIFLGKTVRYPDDIEDWSNLFIYIPKNFYRELAEILQEKGLKEEQDFAAYERYTSVSTKRVEEEMVLCLKEIRKRENELKNKILYMGEIWGKFFYDRFFRMANDSDEMSVVILSECFWMDQDEAESRAGLSVVNAPIFLNYNVWIDDAVEKINGIEKDKWREEINHAQMLFPQMGEKCAAYMILKIHEFYTHLIEIIQPRMIIAETSFNLNRKVLKALCKEKNIPMIYTHPGVIPGTFAFDVFGEMGKSLVSVFYKNFLSLPVSAEELQKAMKVINTVYERRLNRKAQPQKFNIFRKADDKDAVDKKTVLFLGQNDVQSDLQPYTEETKKYHSPNFTSSIEAAKYLADACERNDWNFVYKPHPMYVQHDVLKDLPENTTIVEYGNILDLIDDADVVVTILSSANYDALFRGKPVVMLGYNQTKGKGCTYEAFEKDKIEMTIREALENGFTKEQQDNFVMHVAQMLKYYLYDDMQPRETRYGRPVPKSIDDFYELERLLT